MSSYKITKYFLIPLLSIISITNIYLLGSQYKGIVIVFIIELAVMKYLYSYKKFRATTYQRFQLTLLFIALPTIVYFMIPETDKNVYQFLFDYLLS